MFFDLIIDRSDNMKVEKGKVIFAMRSTTFFHIYKYLGSRRCDVMLNSFRYVVTSMWRDRELVLKEFFALEFYIGIKLFLQDERYEGKYGIDRKRLRKILKEFETKTWISNLVKDPSDFKDYLNWNLLYNDFRFKPLKHQESIYPLFNKAIALNYRGIVLGAATGSGKTFMSLSLTTMSECDKVIIICPLNTLFDVWVNSLEKELFKHKQSVWHTKSKLPYGDEKYILVHYESLKILKDFKVNANKLGMIIDEIHNFAESKSDRTVYLKEVIDRLNPKVLIPMSGTPVKGSINELVNLIEFMDPRITGRIKKNFNEITKRANYPIREAIKARYNMSAVTIKKEDVEMPELRTYKVKLKLPNWKEYTLESVKSEAKKYSKERVAFYTDKKEYYDKEYKTLYNASKERGLSKGIHKSEYQDYEYNIEVIRSNYKRGTLMDIPEVIVSANRFERKVLLPYLVGDEKKRFKDAKSVYKYLALKIQGEVLSRVIGKARENAHLDMARFINYEDMIDSTDLKSIVFSKYTTVCQLVYDKLQPKYKPLRVYGEYTKALAGTVSLFMKDNKLNPLVATYQSLSTGVRLTSANVIIMIDTPFKSYQYDQAVARIFRIRKDNADVFVYMMELDTGEEPNINQRNLNLVNISSEVVEELTGVKLGKTEDAEESGLEYGESDFIQKSIDKRNIDGEIAFNGFARFV